MVRAFTYFLVIILIKSGRQEECGQPIFPPKPTGDSPKIINGEEATPHSFPWMVSLEGQADPHYCGASIISPNWVLTAAHCAKLVFVGTYYGDQVALGVHNRDSSDESGKQTIKVAEVFIHPNYEQPGQPRKSHDIALLKLRSEATFTDTVMPPCLPDLGDFGDSSSFPPSQDCLLSGWGTTPGEQHPSDIYGQPFTLRQATLPLVKDEDCAKIYLEGASFEVQSSMQCAGGKDQTSCNGDSGGPLVCKKDGKWYQVGLVSFGPSPCDAEIPAIYTRVAAFKDWILETIEANGGP